MLNAVKSRLIPLLLAIGLTIPFAFAEGEPSNVQNVAATAASDVAIDLTWDSATADGGGLVDRYKVYYGTTSVQAAGTGNYDSTVETPDNNTTFQVTGLSAETTYYFSVTAIDGADIESEAYSIEASATTQAAEGGEPAEGEEDTASPTVVNVSVVDKNHVLVEFSEAVTLPELLPETAFTITEQITPSNTLEVTSAIIDSNDATGKTVKLETADQTKDVNYVVTAGVSITDAANNPIVSGSFDSGLFLGSELEPTAEPAEQPEEPAEDPTEDPGCGDDEACLLAGFIDCTPVKGNYKPDDILTLEVEIIGEDLFDNNNCTTQFTVTDSTKPQALNTDMQCQIPRNASFSREMLDAVFEGANDDPSCLGTFLDVDITPPEDVTNFILTFAQELEKYSILLSWSPSANTAGDLMDHIVYRSLDLGDTFDEGEKVGQSATKRKFTDLDGGKEYTFKVSTIDNAGNESVGVVKSIRLPETGLGLGFALIASAAGAHMALRRKDDE